MLAGSIRGRLGPKRRVSAFRTLGSLQPERCRETKKRIATAIASACMTSQAPVNGYRSVPRRKERPCIQSGVQQQAKNDRQVRQIGPSGDQPVEVIDSVRSGGTRHDKATLCGIEASPETAKRPACGDFEARGSRWLVPQLRRDGPIRKRRHGHVTRRVFTDPPPIHALDYSSDTPPFASADSAKRTVVLDPSWFEVVPRAFNCEDAEEWLGGAEQEHSTKPSDREGGQKPHCERRRNASQEDSPHASSVIPVYARAW